MFVFSDRNVISAGESEWIWMVNLDLMAEKDLQIFYAESG
jgi:hypothetical protein